MKAQTSSADRCSRAVADSQAAVPQADHPQEHRAQTLALHKVEQLSQVQADLQQAHQAQIPTQHPGKPWFFKPSS